MQLSHTLTEEKGEILDHWIDAVLSSYPADASGIFKREKDRFANPIGYNTKQALTSLYDALFAGAEPDFDKVLPALDEFVKIRAVQTFAPSEAVAFVFQLKETVGAECRKKGAPEISLSEWHAFEALLDRVAAMVFDLYMACRERLYQTRIQEIKSKNHMLIAGGCPSARLREEKQQKAEIQPIHIHNTK